MDSLSGNPDHFSGKKAGNNSHCAREMVKRLILPVKQTTVFFTLQAGFKNQLFLNEMR